MKERVKQIGKFVYKVLNSNVTLTIVMLFVLMTNCSRSGYKQGQKDLMRAIIEAKK